MLLTLKNYFRNKQIKFSGRGKRISNVLMLIIAPLIICCVFLIVSTMWYVNNYRNLLERNYPKLLEAVFNENETMLEEIINSTILLTHDENFMTLFMDKTQNNVTGEQVDRVYSVISTLKEFKSTRNVIYGVALVNRNADLVVTDSGQYTLRQYFDTGYKYKNYSYEYWMDYNYPTANFQALSPTVVGEKRAVIPIVFNSIDNYSSGSLYIILIDAEKVADLLSSRTITKNSSMYIISLSSGELFAQTSNVTDSVTIDKKLLETLNSSDHTVVNNRDGSLTICYSPNSTIFGYGYMAKIPNKDINDEAKNNLIYLLIFDILVVALVFIAAYLSVIKVYNPISKINSLIDPEGSGKQKLTINEITDMYASVNNILRNNKQLSESFAITLPLVCEKYMLDLLNSNEGYLKKDVMAFLSQNYVSFQYENFVSIIVRSKYTDKYYETFDRDQHHTIHNNLLSTIRGIFSEFGAVYPLTAEKNTVYIVLNVDDSVSESELLVAAESLANSFKYDAKFIHVQIGLGLINKDIDGLRESHNQALAALSLITGQNNINVNMYNQSIEEINYLLTIDNENKIFNYLLTGHADDTIELIKEIINVNLSQNISSRSLHQLYMQIFNIVNKVVRIKNIPLPENSIYSPEALTGLANKSNDEIIDVIYGIIGVIDEYVNNYATKIDVQKIVDYIDEHFCDDLYLEQFAEKYQTSSKYLSRLIKDVIGVSFHEYLAMKRITKAKELLESTGMNINSIYEHCGFNNRNTFIRTFKKYVGITPSEYRNNILNNSDI